MKCIRCPICGRPQLNNGLANYCCGKKVSEGEPCKVDLRGYEKAEVCRSGQCGRYDRESDTCQVLTDRGKNGAISWLYSHPDAHCVHPDTPLF